MDFGALIQWIQSIWKIVWFFKIIREYEQGVLLFCGKFKKVLNPGLHFKWSVFEEIVSHYSKDDTILLPSQKLTTKDNKTLTVTGVVLYRIDDIELFLTKVNAPQQAISDAAMGIIAENIIQSDYENTINIKIMNEISKQVRRDCKKWGVYIEYVKLTDLSLSKSINLFKETESHL